MFVEWAKFLGADGRWEEAEDKFVAAFEMLEGLFGVDDPRSLTTIDLLTQALEAQGKHKEANDWKRRRQG